LQSIVEMLLYDSLQCQSALDNIDEEQRLKHIDLPSYVTFPSPPLEWGFDSLWCNKDIKQVMNNLNGSSSSDPMSSWDDVVDSSWPFDKSDGGVLYQPEPDFD
jgi:hypothetical protein